MSPQDIVRCVEYSVLPPDAVWADLNATIEQSGYDAGMLSAGAWERIQRFVRDVAYPRLRNQLSEFRSSVNDAANAARASLAKGVDEVVKLAGAANSSVQQYVAEMKAEGFAGPKSAKIIIMFATADVLKKYLYDAPGIAGADFEFSDWLMLAMFWILYVDDGNTAT